MCENRNIVFFVALASLAYATAYPHFSNDDLEDVNQLVPLGRFRRQSQTSGRIDSSGKGIITHSGTILNNQNHRLDGSGYVGKDFSKGGPVLRPDAYGGRVDYSHKPSHSSFGLSADHVRRGGTDVKATGTWNFVETKNAAVGLSGQYGQHFGPGGGRPDKAIFLGGRVNF